MLLDAAILTAGCRNAGEKDCHRSVPTNVCFGFHRQSGCRVTYSRTGVYLIHLCCCATAKIRTGNNMTHL